MKIAMLRYSGLIVGIALVCCALATGGGQRVFAAAATPTAEPPTPQNTPVPTSPALPGGTAAPAATNTPVAEPPRPTVAATSTREPEEHHGTPDLVLSKSVNVSTAMAGDEVQFTIRVKNQGSATADDVVMTDSVPDAFDVMQATTSRGLVSHNGQTVTVAIGQMREGDEVTITIRARVRDSAAVGSVVNGATVATTSHGDNPANNSDTASLSIATAQVAALASTATPADTATVPSPTPAPAPAGLPRTGDGGGESLWLLAFGLGLIVCSLLLRRKAS